MSTITAIVSDTHIGGSTALALHEWPCDTGEINNDGEPVYKIVQATLAQDWLYSCWEDYWNYVKKLAGKKHRIVIIHGGDVIDGNHHHTVQAMSNEVDQSAMAAEILKPLANMADIMYIIRGTEAHAGEAAGAEAGIAKELGVKCVWEALLDIDGTLIDVAHHGRTGRRSWTSAAAGMGTEAMVDAASENRPLPRYVFRGHNHLVDDSGEKNPKTRAISLPAWTLRTAYGYRIAAGLRSDIGGVIILPDGSLDLSKLRYYAAPGQRQIVRV